MYTLLKHFTQYYKRLCVNIVFHSWNIFRRKTLQMLVGGLWVAICPQWWIDPPLSQTYRGETVQMSQLWSLFLTLRPFGVAHEAPYVECSQWPRPRLQQQQQRQQHHHPHPHQRCNGKFFYNKKRKMKNVQRRYDTLDRRP